MAAQPDTLSHVGLRPRSAAVAIAADPTHDVPYRVIADPPSHVR
jgi:hypothetical protein